MEEKRWNRRQTGTAPTFCCLLCCPLEISIPPKFPSSLSLSLWFCHLLNQPQFSALFSLRICAHPWRFSCSVISFYWPSLAIQVSLSNLLFLLLNFIIWVLFCSLAFISSFFCKLVMGFYRRFALKPF